MSSNTFPLSPPGIHFGQEFDTWQYNWSISPIRVNKVHHATSHNWCFFVHSFLLWTPISHGQAHQYIQVSYPGQLDHQTWLKNIHWCPAGKNLSKSSPVNYNFGISSPGHHIRRCIRRESHWRFQRHCQSSAVDLHQAWGDCNCLGEQPPKGKV